MDGEYGVFRDPLDIFNGLPVGPAGIVVGCVRQNQHRVRERMGGVAARKITKTRKTPNATAETGCAHVAPEA